MSGEPDCWPSRKMFLCLDLWVFLSWLIAGARLPICGWLIKRCLFKAHILIGGYLIKAWPVSIFLRSNPALVGAKLSSRRLLLHQILNPLTAVFSWKRLKASPRRRGVTQRKRRENWLSPRFLCVTPRLRGELGLSSRTHLQSAISIDFDTQARRGLWLSKSPDRSQERPLRGVQALWQVSWFDTDIAVSYLDRRCGQ